MRGGAVWHLQRVLLTAANQRDCLDSGGPKCDQWQKYVCENEAPGDLRKRTAVRGNFLEKYERAALRCLNSQPAVFIVSSLLLNVVGHRARKRELDLVTSVQTSGSVSITQAPW